LGASDPSVHAIDHEGRSPRTLEERLQEEPVRLARQGDAEAFHSMARLVGDRCLAIAVRILRDLDLAEDAVQATLVTAWTEFRTLGDPSRREPWLHRFLTNACYAKARRRRRWAEGLRFLPPRPAPAALTAILTREE
jgi:DNA-directed RNA polymerase specialized sigma24 family protein